MDAYSSANQRPGLAYPANEARVSAVSWAAVAAGAFVGAALSVTLLLTTWSQTKPCQISW